MEGNSEKLYYGYRINRYITGALTGLGIAGIALGIAFTILAYSTWVLILCWVLGIILLAFGIFWHLAMGFTADPKKMESIRFSLGKLLESLPLVAPFLYWTSFLKALH